MDIRDLRYFLAVAREGSITRAAERLNMTQPPLSRQLQELERELGKQLLIRGSKRVTLTEDGILLRRRAEELVELMEKTVCELSGSGQSMEGDVYICGGETEVFSVLASAARRLQSQAPSVRFHFYSGDAQVVMEKLDQGLVDYGLFVGRVDTGKYESLVLPRRDVWGVLMREDSPLASRTAVTPEDLRDLPLILSHQTANDGAFQAWLGRKPAHVAATYDLLYNATHLVRQGLGYAVGLAGIIQTDGERGLCFRPLSPPMTARLTVAWKREQVFSRASKAFLRLLKEEVEGEQ